MADKTSIRVSQSSRDMQGRPVATTRLTPATDATECVVLCEPKTIIPVVFLPGIMGTNLRTRGGGSAVWRPPNMDGVLPILSAIGTLVGFFFRGAATRQRMLDPENTEIDDRGPIDTEGVLDKEEARARGWGALMRSAYHPVMSVMQKELNALVEESQFLESWGTGQLYRRSPCDYGETSGSEALTDIEVKHAAAYRFEVWAGGYNWLRSNEDSAEAIIQHIDDVVIGHYRNEIGPDADKIKVVLVTHSMGGFVARAMDRIHSCERVLGVVHGVMPATGAPATYKRMRSGFEGISKVVLGRNAAEVTAIMANSPGALELLPTPDYGAGSQEEREWLKLGGAAGATPSFSLPTHGDPYVEIYQSRAFHGLVPAHNSGMLDPAGISAPATEIESIGGGLNPFDLFDDRIEAVRTFHDAILEGYPDPAYVHYGDDSAMHAWSTIHWAGASLPASPDGANLSVLSDNGKGAMRVASGGIQADLTIADSSGPGDETVPSVSGRAPGLASVSANFRQGDQGQGRYTATDADGEKSVEGYDHQGSYNDHRARWATIYSIIKVAQLADWA